MSYFVRTYKRRKAFLDSLATGNSISRAAQDADGTTGNFKRWRDSDPNFARDWDDAIEEGTDHIEDVATDRAMTKSDPLMALILKARRPEKFDRASKLEFSGGISVEGSKQKLLNRIAKLQAASALQSQGPEEESQISATEPEAEEIKLLPAPDKGRKRRAHSEAG